MKKSLFATVTASLAILSLTGCPGGGGGGELTMSQQPSTGDGAYSVSITTVNSKDSTQWTADTNGVPYATATGVTFGGVCSRGVNKINAYVDGSSTAEVSQGTCDSNGEFTQSVTFATPNSSTERAGVVHTVIFKPVLVSGTEATSGHATRTVNVDMWGPTFGSITHSGSGTGPYFVSPGAGSEGNAAFTVTGTVSSDTISMSGSSSVATGFSVSFSGTSYTANASLAAGGTDSMVLTAVDRAGNSTNSTSISTEYQNSVNPDALLAGSTSVGGGILDSSGPTFFGSMGGLGSVIGGDYDVILGGVGVYTRYNP